MSMSLGTLEGAFSHGVFSFSKNEFCCTLGPKKWKRPKMKFSPILTKFTHKPFSPRSSTWWGSFYVETYFSVVFWGIKIKSSVFENVIEIQFFARFFTICRRNRHKNKHWFYLKRQKIKQIPESLLVMAGMRKGSLSPMFFCPVLVSLLWQWPLQWPWQVLLFPYLQNYRP